ncbi:MAG: hypothetical protein R3B13_01555 [Polyangiaceae bacterium]
MLTPDVRLEGFTTEDWIRLAAVFRAPTFHSEHEDPSRSGAEAPDLATPHAGKPARGGLLLVTSDGRLRKLVSTEQGRLDIASANYPQPLSALAARHNARWAARIETGALEDLMERFAERLRQEHDGLEQSLTFISLLRELETEGRVEVFPWRMASWPVPNRRVIMRVLDAVCPDGKSIVVGVFEAGELFTALVLRRKGQGFDLVLGPDQLRSEMGLLSGDWQRDYRYLVRAAEVRAAPLSLGCFGEVKTLRKLLHRPKPGAWAAAVAARDVVVSPAPAAIALPLGLDVGRFAFVAVRELAARAGAAGWFGEESPLFPLFQSVRDLSGVDRDVHSLLGFDPMQLLVRLFRKQEDPSEEREAG